MKEIDNITVGNVVIIFKLLDFSFCINENLPSYFYKNEKLMIVDILLKTLVWFLVKIHIHV